MPYTKVVISEDPCFLGTETYSAQFDRKPFADLISEGVVGTNDLLPSWVSGLTVRVAAGIAWVLGENVVDQGMYRQRIPANIDIAVGAGHATLPRLDQVILRIMDSNHDTGGANEGRIEVVPGTPTAGATLVNRNGATALTGLDENSKNVFLVMDVLVPAAAAAISSGNIGDKRTQALVGSGAAANSGALPVGVVVGRAVDAVPAGFLLCDGSAVSRTTYLGLFTALGTTYGTGDGSTTFNLPDYRGRALYGKGTHTDIDALTDNDAAPLADRRPKHRHTVTDPGHVHGIPGQSGSTPWTFRPDGASTASQNSLSATTGITVGPQTNSIIDAGGYHAVNWFIKT